MQVNKKETQKFFIYKRKETTLISGTAGTTVTISIKM